MKLENIQSLFGSRVFSLEIRNYFHQLKRNGLEFKWVSGTGSDGEELHFMRTSFFLYVFFSVAYVVQQIKFNTKQ